MNKWEYRKMTLKNRKERDCCVHYPNPSPCTARVHRATDSQSHRVCCAGAVTRRVACLWRQHQSTRCAAALTATSGSQPAVTDNVWTWASVVCPAVTDWWQLVRPNCDNRGATLSTVCGWKPTGRASSSTCVCIAMLPVSADSWTTRSAGTGSFDSF